MTKSPSEQPKMTNRRTGTAWHRSCPPFCISRSLRGGRAALSRAALATLEPAAAEGQPDKNLLIFCMAGMSYKIWFLSGWPPPVSGACLRFCRARPRRARARTAPPAPRPLGGWRAGARSRPALGARRGYSAACGRRVRARALRLRRAALARRRSLRSRRLFRGKYSAPIRKVVQSLTYHVRAISGILKTRPKGKDTCKVRHIPCRKNRREPPCRAALSLS